MSDLLLPLPHDTCDSIFQSCCGKHICRGCIHAMDEEAYGRGKFESLCAFCRTPAFTLKKDETDCIKKMAESGNAIANYNIGMYYKEGLFGFPLDLTKTTEFLLKAGEGNLDVLWHITTWAMH